MGNHFVPNQTFESMMIPLSKEYSDIAAKPVVTKDGATHLVYTPNPSGFDNVSGRTEFLRSIASGPVLTQDRGYSVEMMVAFCQEHDRPEMVPWANFYYDLGHWYRVGRHPRFSIVGALLEAKQRYGEINRLSWRAPPSHFFEALRKANTQKEFLELMDPHLMDDLYYRGHKFRVARAFKRRFKEKSFTVDDFFGNPSQELRRVILRSVPIENVLGRLKLVSKDSEGALYDEHLREPAQWSSDFRRYLHVKCPSTGQDYLLEVPNDVATPKAARKWTFRLGADAEFAKEA